MADKRISQLAERVDIANNDVVAIVASGATATNKATISSIQAFMQGALDVGVTSVGVTISEIDTAPISVTGSPITTSGNITINLPRATNSIRGVLDSEDFINFSNKQGTITLTTSGTSGDATFDGSLLNIPNYTTDTSGLVPYTGANQTVNLGFNAFLGGNLSVLGASENQGGRIAFKQATNVSTGGGGATSISTFGTNTMTFNFSQPTGSKQFSFNVQNIQLSVAGGRVYTMPDASGTLALTSDLTEYVTLDTAQTITGIKTFFNRLILGNQSQLVFTQKQSFLLPNEGQSAIDAQNNTFIFASSLPNLNSAPQRKLFTFDPLLLPINIQRNYQLPNDSGILALTSDLNAYLPLTGGTLTGALNGTSAVFSGGVNLATSSGNVGIRVSSALYLFHVRTSSNGNVGFRNPTDFNASFTTGSVIGVFNDADNANQPLYLESSQLGLNLVSNANTLIGGNVGIGTTAPQALTHIFSSGAKNIPNLGTAGGHIIIQTGGVTATVLGVNVNGNFYIQPQRINNGGSTVHNTLLNPSGGNVGIGTTDPSARLEVNGTVGFNTTHIPTTDPNISGRIYRNSLGQLFISQ